MDLIGSIIKGFVGIVVLMVGVYCIAMFGSTINAHALQLFMFPIAGAMFLANPPTRKGLAACGLSGMAIIIIAGSSIIGWVLLLTIPPIVGYIVGTKAFKEWEKENECNS
jgi:hypothetical protein